MTPPETITHRRISTRAALILATALLIALGSATTFASDGATSSRTDGEVSNVVQELSQEIESPYCPGKTLAMCPSGGAAEVRRDIQQMAEHGQSKEEIKQTVLAEYGEGFRLREPPAEDHYPLIGLIVLGLAICIGAVSYFARRDDPEPDHEQPADDDWSHRDDIYLQEIRERYEE